MIDDELSDLLREAFAPEPVRPPFEGIAALQHAVARRWRPPPAVRWRHRLAAGGIAVAAVVGSSSVAFALGVPVPGPLQTIAHDIGLPVQASVMAEARSDAARLSHDLATSDAALIRRDAEQLQAGLGKLDPAQRARIAAQARKLLAEADRLDRKAQHQAAHASHGRSGQAAHHGAKPGGPPLTHQPPKTNPGHPHARAKGKATGKASRGNRASHGKGTSNGGAAKPTVRHQGTTTRNRTGTSKAGGTHHASGATATHPTTTSHRRTRSRAEQATSGAPTGARRAQRTHHKIRRSSTKPAAGTSSS